MNWRHSSNGATALAVLAVCVAGIGALHYGSSGFRALSTESARRLQVAERPLALPAAHLRDSDGAGSLLAHELARDGRVALVTFIYARCQSVCRALGTELQQMQAQLHARGARQRVRLVTISFDPRDDARALADYGRRMGAERQVWRLYGVDNEAERRRLLAAFGVVVVPAPLGEFEHNAAFHIVDPRARLVGIVDYANPEAALEEALVRAGDGA